MSGALYEGGRSFTPPPLEFAYSIPMMMVPVPATHCSS